MLHPKSDTHQIQNSLSSRSFKSYMSSTVTRVEDFGTWPTIENVALVLFSSFFLLLLPLEDGAATVGWLISFNDLILNGGFVPGFFLRSSSLLDSAASLSRFRARTLSLLSLWYC